MMRLIKIFLPQLSLFLLLAVCIILWLATYCSFNVIPPSDAQYAEVTFTSNQFHKYVSNMTKELEKQRKQISVLLSKFNELNRLHAHSELATDTKRPAAVDVESEMTKEPTANFVHHETRRGAEILAGIPLNNEFEVVPFIRFTANRLYLVEPGLGRRVIEKPIGYKRKDLLEVMEFALEKLNGVNNDSTVIFTSSDFLEGIFRTLPGFGTHYELYFRNGKDRSLSKYTKVVVTRVLSEPELVLKDDIEIKHKPVNLILPLSGRLDSFKRFMDNFVKVCIHQDKNVFLTLVYFGRKGFEEVQSIIRNISVKYVYHKVQVILLEETFSRSKGLQVGVQSWKKQSDVVLFLCDVDIIFNNDFLERCRLNTESGRKVYYPIVFSLYNPKIVFALQDEPLATKQNEIVISKETGFWRDFGYGMTCQYRQDFLLMKGFDELISGWGMEDVFLYRKYIRSKMFVVRASDPGIFHIWHEKYCDPKLSPDRYRGCIRSKALNEASHSQLGILAFKDEIDTHQALRTNSLL